MNRIRVLFFCFLLLVSAVCGVSAQQEEGLQEDSVALLHQRMEEVAKRYPPGSFFTDDGLACTHHYLCSQMENCNCKEVTAREAGTAGNMQCFGFARFVFYQLFGKPYPHYNSLKPWQVAESEESVNVVCLFSRGPWIPTELSALKELLSQCRFGDVLQTGLPHSMVVVGQDEEGITVYDANFDMITCGVQVHRLTWEDLAYSLRVHGMSLYRSADYPPINEQARLECLLLPRDGLHTDRAPAGLMFSYEKGDYFCTVTCTEDGKYLASDGVRSFVLEDPSAYSLSVSVTAGESFDTGTLEIRFLDAVWESAEEVDAPAEGVLAFSPPSRTEYRVGDALSVEDAYAYVALPNGERRFYFCDGLSFSGFDSSRPGECTVTVQGDGWDASFSVTVLPPPASAPLASSPQGGAALLWWGIGVGGALLVLGGALTAFVFWRRRKEKKEEKEEENEKTT